MLKRQSPAQPRSRTLALMVSCLGALVVNGLQTATAVQAATPAQLSHHASLPTVNPLEMCTISWGYGVNHDSGLIAYSGYNSCTVAMAQVYDASLWRTVGGVAVSQVDLAPHHQCTCTNTGSGSSYTGIAGDTFRSYFRFTITRTDHTPWLPPRDSACGVDYIHAPNTLSCVETDNITI